MQKLYLFGDNVIARIMIEYLKEDLRYHLLGVTLNREYCNVDSFYGYPLVPFEDLVSHNDGFGILNCVGFSKQLSVRAAIDTQILENQIPLLSYIHRSAELCKVKIGTGNLVMNRSVIEPYSVVGNGNIFYGGSYVCHDAIIGNYNWFSSGSVLAGGVTAGSYNFFGINSSIKEKLTIGSFTTVGMGAVVLHDVPDSATVVGNPAKVITCKKER